MKIDLRSELTSFDGAALKDGGKTLTVGGVCVTALMTSPPKEELSTDEKLKRGLLAEQIYLSERDGKELDLTPEQLTLCRNLIGKFFTQIVVLPAYRLLGGEKV